jgi:hypothetical protein
VVVPGEAFCPHHLKLVEEHGEEALKRGEHLPVRRSARRLRAVREPVICRDG